MLNFLLYLFEKGNKIYGSVMDKTYKSRKLSMKVKSAISKIQNIL